jgi:hypothetical protein
MQVYERAKVISGLQAMRGLVRHYLAAPAGASLHVVMGVAADDCGPAGKLLVAHMDTCDCKFGFTIHQAHKLIDALSDLIAASPNAEGADCLPELRDYLADALAQIEAIDNQVLN